MSPDYGTIEAAVGAAAAGSLIYVCAGVYSITSPILIDKTLTLRGDGGLSSILDGGGTSQIIRAVASSPITVDIEDLTFRNAEGADGSAVSVTLDNVALNIRRSTFYANVGSAVYAAWSGGCCWATESLTVDSSTFVGNSASGDAGDGGAIFLFGSSGEYQTHSITNNTFVGNTAYRSGGALALVGDNGLTLASNTFLDNALSGVTETLFAQTSNMAVIGNVFAASTPSSAALCDIVDISFGPPNTFAHNVATGECPQVPQNEAEPIPAAELASFAALDLGPLGNWGGPTQTVRVGPTSILEALQASGCLAADQRGVERTFDACTPGSFEYVASAASLSPLEQTVSGAATTAIDASTAFAATDFTGPVTYSIAPALPSTASLPAGLVLNSSTGILSGTPSVAGTGTFVITATGATAGTASAFITLSINKATQAISVTTNAPGSASVGSTFAVAATSTSGLPVAIAATDGCSGSGSGAATITVDTPDTICTVTYNQAGDGDFDAAVTVTETTIATKASQSISVTSSAPATKVFGGTFTAAASATSGSSVTITTSGGCTGSGTTSITVTMSSGTTACTVTYNQAGTTNYSAAATVTETTTATKASQSISVTSSAPASKVFGGTFTAAASATSGLPVAITTSGGCSGSGTTSITVTMTSGTTACTVTYNQAGTTNYNPAATVTETTTATKLATTVLYTGGQILTLPASLKVSAQTTGAPTCTAVSYALERNPLNQTPGTYPLDVVSGSVSTTSWVEGVYQLTTTYGGDSNCALATDQATLTVAGAGTAATGGGFYALANSGRVNVGFTVRAVPKTTPTQYKGEIVIINNGKWRLKGSVTSYAKTSTSGAIGGTGTLFWWDPSLKSGLGDWALAATNVAYTASMTPTTKTAPGAIGLKITYTPTGAQPATLPNSTPQNLKGGKITLT